MDNTRYDIAAYNEMTMEEKNIFWLKEFGKPYDQVSIHARISFEHASRCTKAYIDADEEGKEILWDLYDSLSKHFCNKEKLSRSRRI